MAERKILDLKESIYVLSRSYPELIELMVGLGFTDIVKPGMLETAGRIMTLPKGARLKKIPIESLILQLEAAGFEVIP